jgi:hypothetical protein
MEMVHGKKAAGASQGWDLLSPVMDNILKTRKSTEPRMCDRCPEPHPFLSMSGFHNDTTQNTLKFLRQP